MLDDLGESTDPRGHHRDAARHRLERGQSEAFLGRGQQEQVGDRQDRNNELLLTQRFDVVPETGFSRPAGTLVTGPVRHRRATAAPEHAGGT